MKKYLFMSLITTLVSLSTFASEQNCILTDVGHAQLGNKFSWTQSHTTVREVKAASLESCLFIAQEKLGTEYNAKITTGHGRSRHRQTRIQLFKVTEVRYKFKGDSFKSKGKIKIPFKDWN